MFSLTKKDILNDVIFNQLKSYKQDIEDYFKNNQKNHGILTLIKKIPYSIDEIKKNDFMDLYEPFYLKNDFLPQQLGIIIWNYYLKQDDNRYNRLKSSEDSKTRKYLEDDEFIEKYGPKPWNIINDILSKFDSLKYRIKSPEELDRVEQFKLELIHETKDNVKVNFSELSSGERILMALVASIYKSSSDNHFPDILLLDEIDASLHPSMIKNLLVVINDIFLEKGVKVILVTHSPSTIALAGEESIFVMNENGENKIEKRTKENALEILTEGFATLSEGKIFFENIINSSKKLVLFVEGKTDIIHIKTAKSKLKIDLDFDIFECGSAEKLRQFLMGIPKGLFSDKKIVGIFDYDEEGIQQAKLIEGSKNKDEKDIYIRKDSSNIKSINLICPNEEFKKYKNCPIEFLYTKKKLTSTKLLEKRSLGEVNKNLKDIEKFNQSELNAKEELWFFKIKNTKGKIDGDGEKMKFTKNVSKLDQKDFENFKPLFEKIERIIKENEN